MKIFRVTLITALVALFLVTDIAVFAQPESDAPEIGTRPAKSRYRKSQYNFRFYPLKTWEEYTETGMRNLLKDENFRGYGLDMLGFTEEDIDAKKVLFFGKIKRKYKADIGRFERLNYMGLVFGDAEEIADRYDRVRGKTTDGKEGDVYTSYTETMRTVTINKKGSEDEYLGDKPGRTGRTYSIGLRIYYIELPNDKAAMLTFGCKFHEAKTYAAEVESWIADKFKIDEPEEKNTEKYDNAEFGFSFERDHIWQKVDVSGLSKLKDFQNFLKFEYPKALENGRVILFAAGEPSDVEANIWAVPTFMIVIQDEGPHVDEAFRRSRETKISNEMTYMRRTGSIDSQIETINGVKVCRVEVAGTIKPDNEKITQVFYFIPLGTKGATLMFSFPESAGYSKDKINTVVRDVRSSFEGVQSPKIESNASYYLIGFGVLVVGVVVFFFFRIRSKMKRMGTRLDKRTYQHTGFKPKDLSLKPQKPSSPSSDAKPPKA